MVRGDALAVGVEMAEEVLGHGIAGRRQRRPRQ
jgi:hypothetical protein